MLLNCHSDFCQKSLWFFIAWLILQQLMYFHTAACLIYRIVCQPLLCGLQVWCTDAYKASDV
jgi:hypothetical protein